MLTIKRINAGEIYTTKNCGDIKVIEYIDSTEIIFIFLNTGFISKTKAIHIRSGEIKDPMAPSVYGVGFIGVGKHQGSRKKVQSKAYRTWIGMLERCYCQLRLIRQPAYLDCHVHEEWHNFQNFADWHEINYIEGYHLDKDLLIYGSRIYSKETCVYIPGWLNLLMVGCRESKNKYPMGVCKMHSAYVAQMNTGKTSIVLGRFKNIKDAENAYLLAKGQRIIECSKKPDVPEKLRIPLFNLGQDMLIKAGYFDEILNNFVMSA